MAYVALSHQQVSFVVSGRFHAGKRSLKQRLLLVCLSVCLFHIFFKVYAVIINYKAPTRPAYISSFCPTADTLIMLRGLKLKFHGTDTDTDTDILADLTADLSDTRAFPREDVR